MLFLFSFFVFSSLLMSLQSSISIKKCVLVVTRVIVGLVGRVYAVESSKGPTLC